MGWYTNYEVEFSTQIDWNEDMQSCLTKFKVEHLYLRDLELPRVIMCVYSNNPVESILESLKNIYKTDIRYRVYGTDVWVTM